MMNYYNDEYPTHQQPTPKTVPRLSERRRETSQRPRCDHSCTAPSALPSVYSLAYTPLRAISSSWEPSSTTLPLAMTTIASALRIVERRCATMIVVRPLRARSMASCTRRSLRTSSALVASSRSSSLMRSLRARVRAMATRWRWPPDRREPRSPTTVFRPSTKLPTNSVTLASSIAVCIWTSVQLSKPYWMLREIDVLNRRGSCSTAPMCLRRLSVSTVLASTPSTRIRPLVGSYMRCSSCSTVDLPDPDIPTSATVEPAGICSEKFSRIVMSGREGYENDTFSNVMSPRSTLAGGSAPGMVIFSSSEFRSSRVRAAPWRAMVPLGIREP
eukprot:m.132269 g.132269  ORF g.132269 m.132269 type:complete len:330 (-) comp9484_c1_seq3:1396-2385(-)